MKKIFISAVSLAALTGSALAADLPSHKEPVIAPPPPPMWTGLYAGINAGYGFGTANNAQNYAWTNPNFFGDNAVSYDGPAFLAVNSSIGRNIDQGGFIGGGQIGYNYQYGQNFLIGFETDMQGAGISGQGSALGVAPTRNGIYGQNFYVGSSTIQAGINWMGTARGRIGYLVAPTVLLYATGGLAYGGTYVKTFPSSYGVNTEGGGTVWGRDTWTQNSQQNFNVGWTAGGGFEWMMAPNWSIKGEAMYYDLGSTSVTNTVFEPDGNLASNNPSGGSTTKAYYQGAIARAGVNYHFNLGSMPVVAKF